MPTPSRADVLLAPVSPVARIIEIGPSFSPLAPRSAGWDTRVVDHLSRDGLVAKYRDEPHVDVSRIEAVDDVWTAGALSGAVPASLHGSFDALLASHVVEHTPDLLGFLASAETLLTPDGVVVLAVPDKRYCFDYFQPLTTAGQVLQAAAEHRSRHTPRLAFDHFAYAVTDGGLGAWWQRPSGGLRLTYTLEQAAGSFERLQQPGEYVDVHAWHFLPSSFELLLLELAWLGRTDWRVERITGADGCEFFCWLRRGGRAAAAALSGPALAARRLALLKQTLIESRAQIDWLLAGEPELVTGPLGLLPTASAAPSPS